MSPVDLLLAVFAGLMALTTAALLRWAAEARTHLSRAVVVFLLVMMGAMFAGSLVYFLTPGRTSLVEGLWLSAGIMSVSVFPLLSAFLDEAQRRVDPSGPQPLEREGRPGLFLSAVIGLVLASEFLMGWTFLLASGSGPIRGGAAGVLVSVIDSPWFLFTMAAEMAATAYLLRDRLASSARTALALQAAVMALSPPALRWSPWITASIVAGSAVMIGFILFVLEFVYRNPQIDRPFSHYLLAVLGAYAVMMAGLFVWVWQGSADLFAGSILLEMGVYFAFAIRPSVYGRSEPAPWSLRPNWTFLVLSSIFVAELFMGAVIDLQIAPGLLAPGGVVVLPLSGGAPTVITNALSNGFWFLATVTASTGFLVMMGLEMGALVAFKFRESKNPENRVRLALMIGSYAAFTAFYPSLYFGMLFPSAPDPSQVPVLGWSMGIGSYPIAPTVFVALLLTYAITGALVVLFGRRVVCSTLCSAALMDQGTAIDAMKSFNQRSPVGRKFLSSRFSGLYQATSGVVMGSLAGASVVSYLDTTGAVHVFIEGTDPTVFLFALYFSVLWYVLFVTIPYTGTYNCVTMGWCYTGTFAQAFHKIGFFKLKVRNRQVCKDCTTLDCARGCPVGLVDMPGHFRSKGEFRSTKCCGVGDCVEACPYGNLYIADVRHWVRRRLGREEAPPHRAPLPRIGRSPSGVAGFAPALIQLGAAPASLPGEKE